MDRSEDDAYHGTDDGADVAHDAGPDLDQLELEAGQRPVGHRLG